MCYTKYVVGQRRVPRSGGITMDYNFYENIKRTITEGFKYSDTQENGYLYCLSDDEEEREAEEKFIRNNYKTEKDHIISDGNCIRILYNGFEDAVLEQIETFIQETGRADYDLESYNGNVKELVTALESKYKVRQNGTELYISPLGE